MSANFQDEGEIFRTVQRLMTVVVATVILMVATVGFLFFQTALPQRKSDSHELAVDRPPSTIEVW
ncbi:MAG: hypothetical protein WEB30_09045, partial [Cyclobacteriaceae bacterium]